MAAPALPEVSKAPAEVAGSTAAPVKATPSRVWLAAALVFAMALALRLWQIDLARFADDQATLLGSAALIVSSHIVPATDGLSFTIGVRHPPLTALLLAVPVAISRNPAVVSAFMGLLDACAAVLVYLAARSIGGLRAGLFAGLLYALEPAAIVYGRTVWNPDFVPFFTALAVLGMLEYWRRGSMGWQGAALLAIGCGIQVHPQMVALLPVWLAISIAKRRWGWPSLAAVGLLVLTLIPYIGLQIQSGGADLQGALTYLRAGKQTDSEVFATLAELFSGRAYTELLLPSGSVLAPFATDALGWCWSLLLIAGLALALIRRRPLWLITTCCFVLPIALTVRHTAGVAPHYVLMLLPIGAILAGLALAAIRPAALASGIALLVLAGSGYEYVLFQLAIPEQGPASNYGIPVRYTLSAAELVRAAHTNGPVYVADADEYAGTFPYLLGREMAIKRFDGRYTFVFPQADALYIADAQNAFAYKLLGVSSGGPFASVNTPSGQPAFGLFRMLGDAAQAYDRQAPLEPLDVDFAHAARLTGYSAPVLTAGKASAALLEWRATDATASTPGDLRQFAHLVDAAGSTWSTAIDVRGYPRSLWQTGDVVLSSFELGIRPDAPTGGYWLETGFYEPVTGQRLTEYVDGGAMGTAARIGPLKVSGISPQTSGPPLATFGADEMALLGIHRSSNQVVLRWQALRKPSADYTVFVHVVNAQGQLVGQNDSPPKEGSYPTSLWDAGEVVEDAHQLDVPDGSVLEIGLYTRPDLRRIQLSDGLDHLTVHV